MNSRNDPLEQARKLAATPQGRQLAQLLWQQTGDDLQSVLDQASAGDLQGVRQTVSRLLQDPGIRQLLQQMGDSHGK